MFILRRVANTRLGYRKEMPGKQYQSRKKLSKNESNLVFMDSLVRVSRRCGGVDLG